ncbi:unnamed protein product [Brassica napus]|uniref:(rape) hypothetical protein n=1 Tax=Brassica napus TaxID=3708 RepID=A0A816LMB8_BRANA|nr:unnamed protein product [Brassica napus]
MTELISKSIKIHIAGIIGVAMRLKGRYVRLENDNHIFKWVDEAFTDEIRQLDYQVRMLEEEVQVLKATIRSEGNKIISGGHLILGLSVVVVVGFGFFDVQVIPKAMTKLNFLFFLSFSYVSPKLCEVERL